MRILYINFFFYSTLFTPLAPEELTLLAVLAGDCDDYAITMVAAIKSIGGEARFVSTTGHLYPEIKIGTKYDLAQITGIVKNVLFPIESEGMSLHYHVDKDENIWLNLDYTAAYPGGKFPAPMIKEGTGI